MLDARVRITRACAIFICLYVLWMGKIKKLAFVNHTASETRLLLIFNALDVQFNIAK